MGKSGNMGFLLLKILYIEDKGGEYVRNFIVVLCTSFFIILLPTAVHANESPETQKEEKVKRGLVGGLLQQVKGTVDKTVKTTGDLVEETVKFTGDTVERTVNLTTDTVNTVTDPKQKRPVKAVVENTTNFVGETVEKTVPVVEQTTKTVQTVTNETVKVTKPLPKVPVVTPVVDKTTETVEKVTEQVKHTVDNTVGTVTETVSKPLKKEPEKGNPQSAEVKPVEEAGQTQEPSPTLPAEKPNQQVVTGKPSQGPSSLPEVNEPETKLPSEEKRPEAKPDVDRQGESVVHESGKGDSSDSMEVEVSHVTERPDSQSLQNAKAMEDQFSMERNAEQTKPASTDSKTLKTISSQATPLEPSNGSTLMSDVQLITGASSINVSAPSTSSGISGFGAVLGDDWLMNAEIVRQKWVLEDLLGMLQCSHAPPGQPPQSTPFLYVI